MYSLIFLVVTSFIVALFFTPACKKLALRYDILDLPDKDRKLHSSAIPRLGGVAIFAAVLFAYGMLLFARMSSGHLIWEDLPLVLHILPALLLVFLVGLLDDIFNLKPWAKLAIETAAAIMAWFGGIHVKGVEGHEFSPILGFIITIMWLVSCTNAINLIDGMDGLAAGTSFFAAVTMSISALIDHNYSMALVSVPLVGALLGFLKYNLNPATIFLGDCGSLSLGFLLACCGAVWSEKATTAWGMTAPLLALAVPLLDTSLAVARRFIANRRVFSADYAHIHHKLLSKGLKPKHVVLVLYAASAGATVASLLIAADQNRYRGVVILLVGIAAWGCIQYLGYREFDVVRRAVLGGTFREVLSSRVALDAFQRDMQQDVSLQECLTMICETHSRFGFSGISFQLDDIREDRGTRGRWQVRIEFSDRGYITLWRSKDAGSADASVGLFLDCIPGLIDQKLEKKLLHTVPRAPILRETLPAYFLAQSIEGVPLKSRLR